jgi:hypothetical protein
MALVLLAAQATPLQPQLHAVGRSCGRRRRAGGMGVNSLAPLSSRPAAKPRAQNSEFQTNSAWEEIVHGDQGTAS